MNRVLVVDDSDVDRKLIGGLLRNIPGVAVDYAQDGAEAVDRIERRLPDLVITDLVMPRMDGLELVRHVRGRAEQTPIILMTAHGSQTLALDALEAGAASYVPKSQQAERLADTVRRVFARLEVDRRQRRVWECFGELNCSVSLENEPDLIAPLLDIMQQAMAGMDISDATGRLRTVLALEQALLNAMYHGNLEMNGSNWNAGDRRFDVVWRQVGERRSRKPYRNRQVHIDAHLSPRGARFTVRDEGPGFDAASIELNGWSEAFEGGRNRGLTLMRAMMDEVSFNDVGNQVTMVKRSDRSTADETVMA